jgi:DNA-binding transcriptional regulator YdaS (Cro superfamily)
MTPQQAIRRAADIAGGVTKLGRILGCSPQRVCNWKASGRTPVKFCPIIESVTGVRCEELRPDVNWEYMRKQPQWSGCRNGGASNET